MNKEEQPLTLPEIVRTLDMILDNLSRLDGNAEALEYVLATAHCWNKKILLTNSIGMTKEYVRYEQLLRKYDRDFSPLPKEKLSLRWMTDRYEP